METVNNLRNKLSVLKILKITKMPRYYIYYKRKDTVKQRKSGFYCIDKKLFKLFN